MKKLLFNLSHWCLKYEDYLEAEKSVRKKVCNNTKDYQEKSDLEFYFDNPMCDCPKQEVRTSGSTGTPIRFWCNKERIASSLALVDYRFKQLGLKKDDVFMKFWYPTTGHTFTQILKEKLFRLLTKEKFFSYFDLVNGTKTVDDFIDYVNKEKPDFIEGYAGGLISIASYILDNNRYIHSPRTIVTGAGMVTYKQHELIEKAFDCKHYDRYGCSEFGEIAHQLGNGYYEPNPYLFIEVSEDLKKFIPLEDAKDGEYEIFVSDYRNTCTPFERYRMHDIVRVQDGKIIGIAGRTEKMYKLSDGRFLPTGFFYQAVKDFTDIHQWQVEIDNDWITLRTMPRTLNAKERKQFEKYFGDNKFSFRYEQGNFITIGRREKIQEVIVR